ncbi:MAG: peptidase M28 family protein, partial [Bacteroidota bacterium]
MKKLFYLLLLGLLHPVYSSAQNEDFKIIKKLYDNALTSKQAYNQLGLLCEKAPGRLIGTKNSFIAVDLMKKYLIDLGADTVFLQEFSSPAWICHSASASMHIDGKEIKLNIDALGPSASTPENGITAEIIEVKSLDELRAIGTEKIKGKI